MGRDGHHAREARCAEEAASDPVRRTVMSTAKLVCWAILGISVCARAAAASPWQQRFVTHDEVRIEYRVRAGTGVPVVLVPGMSNPARDIEDNAALVTALGSRTLIAISIRGRGASDAPEAGWTIAAQASDIAAVVHQEHLARYHLVAHSMGVGYALHQALAHPTEVASFTAADYRPGLPLVSEEWVARGEDRPRDERYEPRIKRRMLREQGAVDWIPELAEWTVPTLAILSTQSSDRFVEDMWKRAPAARVLWIEHGHDTFTNADARVALVEHLDRVDRDALRYAPFTRFPDEPDELPPLSDRAGSSSWRAVVRALHGTTLRVIAGGNAPVDIAGGVELVFPWRMRLGTTFGAMPPAVSRSINARLVDAGIYDQATGDVVSASMQRVLVWRTRVGVQPWARHGFIVGIGYALASLHGRVPLECVAAAVGMPDAIDAGGTQFDLASRLHLVDAQVGWEWRLGDHWTIGVGLGAFVLATSRTRVTVDPPTRDAMIQDIGARAVEKLEHAYDRYVRAPLLTSFLAYTL